MDIRPDPLQPDSADHQGPTGTRHVLNERNIRLVVFALSVVSALVVGGGWLLQRSPGASIRVGKTGKGLPLAGERTLPLLDAPGEQQPTPITPFVSEAVSPLSGISCANSERRPIGVMLASDPISRPVSGLSFADMVFELPALVNNVTRLLAVYQCQKPREIGSVRSARHDYLFLAAGIDAVIVHWGGSYHALNRLRLEGNVYNSLSALGTGQQAFYRKSNLPAPYNGFTSYERLWDALQKATYRTKTVFAGYPHRDEALPGQRGAGGTLDIGWPGAMRVRYVYNPQLNVYERSWGGQRHFDAIDHTPVNPRVVVIMHADQRLASGPGGYNDVDVEGTGRAEVYQDGQVIQGFWEKSATHKQDPVHFRDALGQEIPFVRGQVWIHVVDPRTAVRWTPGLSAPPELETEKTPANLGG